MIKYRQNASIEKVSENYFIYSKNSYILKGSADYIRNELLTSCTRSLIHLSPRHKDWKIIFEEKLNAIKLMAEFSEFGIEGLPMIYEFPEKIYLEQEVTEE